VKGAARHAARLKRLQGAGAKLRPIVYAAADMLAAEAALSITAGAQSGAGHVPSGPGEPPNADTGKLDRSIHVEQIDDLSARVVADPPYAVPLEFGTSRIAERPFMRPAAKKIRPEMQEMIRKALQRETRR
jgi:HK97 gp10 family phage protein